ncbi:MAG: sulfatase-like hydrolase/transferase [Myxococcota bacterium]
MVRWSVGAGLAAALAFGCGGNPLGATPRTGKGHPAEPAPAPAPGGPVTPDARPTNFLVIVADDLGTDKVRAYHEQSVTPSTPSIDGLAADGVLFRNAYTYPTCSSSRAALLTGRYGRRNGMGGIVDLGESTYELPLGEITIPEALDRKGRDWHAAAIGKWHLSGFRTEHAFEHPLKQGFDHYAGCIGNLVLTSKDYGQRGNYFHYEKDTDGEVSWSTRYATAETTDDAVGQLKTLPEPWFLWVAYNAPHEPFHAPPADLLSHPVSKDATDLELHTAAVEAMDREIGRLLASMSDAQRRSTTIVFVGDNGTDQGAILPPLDPSHGKASLFEGGTNVPLIVSGAGVPGPGEAKALVHAVDLLPTVLELAGASADGLVLDGQSFASVLANPRSDGPRRTVYTERFSPIGGGPYDVDMVALRDARYKILRTKQGGFKFFDLQGRFDDGEGRAAKELTGPDRARFEALKAELDEIARTVTYGY